MCSVDVYNRDYMKYLGPRLVTYNEISIDKNYKIAFSYTTFCKT